MGATSNGNGTNGAAPSDGRVNGTTPFEVHTKDTHSFVNGLGSNGTRPLEIAVVGYGNWGSKHTRVLAGMPDVNVTVVDMGSRFRIIVNEVNIVAPLQPLPRRAHVFQHRGVDDDHAVGQ